MTKNDVEKIASFIAGFSEKNDVFEDVDVLRFTKIGKISEQDIFDLKSIKIPIEEISDIYIQAEVDLEIQLDDLCLNDFDNQSVSFVFSKKKQDERVVFFTEKAFSTFLQNTLILPRTVYLLGVFNSFCSYTTSVSPFYDKCDPTEKWNGLTDARKVIKILSSNCNIVSDVSSWLLSNYRDIKDESCFYKIFLTESSKRLFILLSSEVFTIDGVTYLEFDCDRKVRLNIDLIKKDDSKFLLYSKEIANLICWVFENNNEVEARHTLLNYQMALESVTQQGIRYENFLLSLQNAKNSYNYFLKSKSKEMMRSLSDLKKSVSSELSEHNKNTYNIIKNMWRDFMFAAVAIAYDILTEKSNYHAVKSVLLFVSIAITISYMISIYSELRYQCIVSKNMKAWYPQLYSFLTKEEMERLIQKPIKSIRNNLYVVLIVTFILYLIVNSIILRNIVPFLNFIRF